MTILPLSSSFHLGFHLHSRRWTTPPLHSRRRCTAAAVPFLSLLLSPSLPLLLSPSLPLLCSRPLTSFFFFFFGGRSPLPLKVLLLRFEPQLLSLSHLPSLSLLAAKPFAARHSRRPTKSRFATAARRCSTSSQLRFVAVLAIHRATTTRSSEPPSPSLFALPPVAIRSGGGRGREEEEEKKRKKREKKRKRRREKKRKKRHGGGCAAAAAVQRRRLCSGGCGDETLNERKKTGAKWSFHNENTRFYELFDGKD